MSKENITGKVARVLNSRELAINVGEENGVEMGMCFDVMDPNGEDIQDPDTGEIIGSIERPKVRVKVIKVKPKLAVTSTYRKQKVNIGGRGTAIDSVSRMFMPPEWVTKYETLKTKEKTWESLTESESYVKIGDPVVQAQDIDDDTEIS